MSGPNSNRIIWMRFGYTLATPDNITISDLQDGTLVTFGCRFCDFGCHFGDFGCHLGDIWMTFGIVWAPQIRLLLVISETNLSWALWWAVGCYFWWLWVPFDDAGAGCHFGDRIFTVRFDRLLDYSNKDLITFLIFWAPRCSIFGKMLDNWIYEVLKCSSGIFDIWSKLALKFC